MAVIKDYIKAEAPTKQQISNAYKDFAKQVKSIAKDINSVTDASIFNRYLTAKSGNVLFVYDSDNSRMWWMPDSTAKKTVAVEVHIYTAQGYQKIGSVKLLQISFFANGLQDNIREITSTDDILKLIKERTEH